MAFKPIRYDSGQTTEKKTITGATVTKWDALAFSSGYVKRATNATTEVRYVALEDKTADSSTHEDIQVVYTDGVEFEVETADSMAQSYVGTYVDLTDHDTIDPDSGSDNAFYITEMVGTGSDKECKGFFVMKTS